MFNLLLKFKILRVGDSNQSHISHRKYKLECTYDNNKEVHFTKILRDRKCMMNLSIMQDHAHEKIQIIT